MQPLISIVTPCFNEADNIGELVTRIRNVMSELPSFRYEHIFIDNASSDESVDLIKSHAATDLRIRLIVNNRNFGHVRSPAYAVLQAQGDAVIAMASDLQDPPELIPEFLHHWERGFKVVIGTKPVSRETPAMFLIRRLFYRTIGKISEVPLIENFTGFGLYDREVIDRIRAIDDPYPYFRGLIAELGYLRKEIPFEQPRRIRGITKNNFYTLYDIAMLGITSYSKVPLRIATMAGFTLSVVSLIVAIGYFVAKIVMWDSFSVGVAPLVVGLFFFASIQLFFIGILGEYIGSIHTLVSKHPLVIERERVNFTDNTTTALTTTEDQQL